MLKQKLYWNDKALPAGVMIGNILEDRSSDVHHDEGGQKLDVQVQVEHSPLSFALSSTIDANKSLDDIYSKSARGAIRVAFYSESAEGGKTKPKFVKTLKVPGCIPVSRNHDPVKGVLTVVLSTAQQVEISYQDGKPKA